MAGTIVVNVCLGMIAFAITLVTALSGNVLFVSFERAVYAFILFFLLGFPMRWLIGRLFPPSEAEEATGSHIDLVTPEDQSEIEPQNDADDPEPEEGFVPFQATRIERKDEEAEATKIANAIRRFTDD